MKKGTAVFIFVGLVAAFFAARGECATNEDFQVKKSVPQATPFSKELSIQVAKDSSANLPELTDEAVADIQTALAKQFTDEGWVVKKTTETPLCLTVTINSYQQGN